MFCALMTGIYIRSLLNDRITYLEKLIEMVEIIRSQLNYSASNIHSLLELLTNQKSFKQMYFLNTCLNELNNGTDFVSSWEYSLSSFKSPLNKEDKEIIVSFGFQLGKSDLEGQLSNCDLYKDRLRLQLDNARKNKEKNGDMYMRLSVLSGVLIVILLL